VLLKSGRPVADVAYYIGENTPVMTGTSFPQLPIGHDFDFINSDALIHRAKVVDGRIALENGPSYAVLVLPRDYSMRPEVATTLQRLVREGAIVVGLKPTASPSLAGHPACDDQVRAIADEVWGDADGEKTKRHAYGKGAIYLGASLVDVFADLKLTPDMRIEDSPHLRFSAAGARDNLANVGIGMGIGKKGGVVFTHRTSPEQEVYFLSNTSDSTAAFTASLRVTGRQPELWNASSGETRPATAFTQKEGRTLIPLRLVPSESIFLVLAKPIPADASGITPTNTPELETLATLNGPWTVRFHGQDAPAETTFPSLSDWSTHANPAIRHYSGTAIYQTRFDLTKSPDDTRTILSLGDVGIMAKVFINGSEAGTAWSPPWTIDIGDHLKPGENTLEIHVTNTWNNRLVADASLPAEKRHSHLSEGNLFTPKDPLLKSGLIGPVMIRQSK
jgi:alpha-L-rhamnosidase